MIRDFYILLLTMSLIFVEINFAIICARAVGFPAFFDAQTPLSFGSLVGSLLARRSASKINMASEDTTEKPYEGAARSAENEMLGKSGIINDKSASERFASGNLL